MPFVARSTDEQTIDTQISQIFTEKNQIANSSINIHRYISFIALQNNGQMIYGIDS